MIRALAFFLIIVSFSFPAKVRDIGKFFTRTGYVVEVSDGRVILDLGRGRAFKGEVFEVILEGEKIYHPVTGRVLGRKVEVVGKVKIEEVKRRYSVAKIVEGENIRRGDKVRLSYGEVCFWGTDEGYFKVSAYLEEVKRGTDCPYIIREFEDGFGVEFMGRAIAFFQKLRKVQVVKEREPEEFNMKAKLVLSFDEIPLSADSCRLTDNLKEFLAVLFENRVVFYEILKKELVEFTSFDLPPGYPIWLECAPLEGTKDYLIVNMISGEDPSSLIVKFVSDSPVVVKKNIPYFLSVLDKENPQKTFVAQSFDARDGWGSVKKVKLVKGKLKEEWPFPVPSGFRLDGAFMYGDTLIFVDKDGYLRVFWKDQQLLSKPDFDGSYTTAQIPEAYDEDEETIVFNPKGRVVSIGKKAYPLVIRNVRSPVYKFLNVNKFTEGEVYVLLESKKRVKMKKIVGPKFEEALQAIVSTKSGRIFLFTARTGTLPASNRGEAYEVTIKATR